MSRTEEVARRLREEILSGALAPGAQLPTEQQLVARLGISRTVVREAVAALRAEGLLVTRQGVGAFVADGLDQRPFRVDTANLTSLDRVLHLIELRAAIETEAAGLAAERHRPRHLQHMTKALAAMDAALEHGDAAVRADFEFHCAVAAATGNPFFVEVLRYLGQLVIPRHSLRVVSRTPDAQRQYLRRIQQEHRAIHEAIASGRAAEARVRMSAHLRGSQRRYRAGAPVGPTSSASSSPRI
jgi:DNA-binding FadR family transcriptional regulator